MKTLLVTSVAALAFGVTGAFAQSTATPAAQPSTAMSNTASTNTESGGFIAQQEPGTFRAPKLVGVAVYDNTNKDVGKVSDLLLDKNGQVQTVVISVGGFLGIGSKDVAVPFSALKWQTEQRTAATGEATGSGSMAGNPTNATTTNGAAMNNNTAMKSDANNANTAPKMTTAQTEAYQGYPDRAVIEMSQAQLKSAPEFKYASSTMSK